MAWPMHRLISAKAGLHRLDYSEHRVRCNGSVDSRSAVSQDLRGRRGSQRLAGGGDALLRDHHGAAVVAPLAVHRNHLHDKQCRDFHEHSHDSGYSNRSIFGGFLNVIDDQDFDTGLLGIEPEAELFPGPR